jgi:hypothetical protein
MYSSLFFGPFCMAHSLALAGEIYSLRQDGSQSEQNSRRPCSCPTCAIRSGENAPKKALTISGADRFSRRGGACRLHAIFMNRLLTMWGYQEELSSTAACSRAEGNCPLNSPASHVP